MELIRELSMCFGPSGCEDEVRRVIREQIGDAALSRPIGQATSLGWCAGAGWITGRTSLPC